MTDPYPWDTPTDTTTTEPPVEAGPSTDVAVPSFTLDPSAVLDELGADPALLHSTAADLKATILDAVRTRIEARRDAAPEKITDTADVRGMFVGALADCDVLDALAGAFRAGAVEAKLAAGEVLDELPPRGGKPRRSVSAADGHGFKVTVTRAPDVKLAVVDDEVDDVLASWLLNGREDAGEAAAYATGARDALAALRGLLSSSPAYRSTALDALATRLENDGCDPLAKRLRAAYSRQPTGRADKLTITRTSIDPEGTPST